MEPNRDSRRIKTADKAFEIIELIGEDRLTLTEITNQLPLSKSTVHHYLTTLHRRGYLIREDNEYFLSLRFLDHGIKAKNSRKLSNSLNPAMKDLAEDTGEIAWVAVAEGGKSYILELERGEKAVHTGEHIGLRQDLHCHAAGKSILAHMPDERVDEIIAEHGLPKHTDRTITDRSELDQELEIIRDEGVAYMIGETIKGLNSVGAPIISKGAVLGAISVAGPAKRVGEEELQTSLAKQVQAAANAIELEITYA